MTVNDSDETDYAKSLAALEIFIRQYVNNKGIQVYLWRSLFLDLASSGVSPKILPEQLMLLAVEDLNQVMEGRTSALDFYDAASVAPSISFFVELARKVDPNIIPRDVIPNASLTHKLLLKFHAQRQLSKE